MKYITSKIEIKVLSVSGTGLYVISVGNVMNKWRIDRNMGVCNYGRVA